MIIWSKLARYFDEMDLTWFLAAGVVIATFALILYFGRVG